MARAQVMLMAVALVLMLAAVPRAAVAIDCGHVDSLVRPCLSYVQGGPSPSGQCCGGVQSLHNQAQSKSDRQAACNCLKGIARGIHNLNEDNARSLAPKCGVNLPYHISLDIDCNSV
ncbi:non-specific lipid-transfer protein [Aegilops tauschii subsp. strangulata]|uniref:Non-specific lipid-transfer protein n=2 Tax=Aegilops tauschii TaxID=37682 RepID=A0A453KD90_AEGTS|nr:non-specific lipid-transfer protein [Aegilops tauschii subsp. strangulata]XP_044396278.1 non-specific lipid-transfer protein-like [Triticum aestivum]AAQ54611.1 Gly d Mal d 3-like protein [Glycyphagus domesticus]